MKHAGFYGFYGFYVLKSEMKRMKHGGLIWFDDVKRWICGDLTMTHGRFMCVSWSADCRLQLLTMGEYHGYFTKSKNMGMFSWWFHGCLMGFYKVEDD